MKKIVLPLILIVNYATAQSPFLDYTLKAPNVASLLEIKNLDLNEAQGKLDFSIPLYTIAVDDMTIPISLNHNSDGTRVEYESSWVGNSWGLNAGGFISRKVNGRHGGGNFYIYFPNWKGL